MDRLFQFTGHTVFALTLACVLGCLLGLPGPWLTLAITFGTMTYHFYMRLTVSGIVNAVMHNHADWNAPWFRVRPREQSLYKKLRVKHWKDKMPTYDPASFDPKTHSWNELAQTTCQSEVVHEWNMLLSFVPLLAAKWAGAFWVFLATSLLGAAGDGVFVVMQRFNRVRMVKMALRQQQRTAPAEKTAKV